MNMSWIGKLAGIASIGEAISTFAIARRLVHEVAVILSLVIVGAMIAGAFVVAGFYECYAIMVRHGVSEDIAVLTTAVIGLILIGGLAWATITKIRDLKRLPLQIPSVGNMVAGPVRSLVKGFYHGVTARRS